jgi:uncharacterized RDD family membrane protein YckC
VYCSKCGSAVAPGTAFCGVCGTPVAPTAVSPEIPRASGVAAPYAAAGTPTPYLGSGFPGVRNVTYAGFWLRFVAHIVDSLILGVAMLALLIPLLFLTGMAANFGSLANHRGGEPDPAMVAGILSLVFAFAAVAVIVQWLYEAYLESGEKQATWGKQAMGVYVTDLQGNRLTFGRASGRFFAKIVSGMIPLGIGYIMAGFTERRQALHDMIASCLVLKR